MELLIEGGGFVLADVFIANGEVIWDGDDIALVDGLEDIKQQAYLRSIADEGESVFYPSYGSKIFMYLGKPYTKNNKAFVEQAAREALLAVEEIDEVLSVLFKKAAVDMGGEIERADYYIYAEYKTKKGKTLKEAFVYVAQ